jgi:hypothetical protein
MHHGAGVTDSQRSVHLGFSYEQVSIFHSPACEYMRFK